MLAMHLTLLLLYALCGGISGENRAETHHREASDHTKLYSQHLREKFEQSFHNKCMKYPFVDKWVNSIENARSRNYYTFMFQEPGLKNGGLGDRIGGLLTAIGTSLRTNRTLLIESSNDFHELFRPYHPSDVKLSSNDSKYSWKKKKWKNWIDLNQKWSGNDDWELDLWYCVNCPAWRNKICGLDDGDTGMSHKEPYVRLRGNRAFLCKWASHPELGAHKQLLRLVSNSKSHDSNEINWYEVAGCMLRLAMWPTERLWSHISVELEKQLGPQLKMEATKSSGASNWDSTRSVQIAAHFRCGDYSYIQKDAYNQACVHDVSLDVPVGSGGKAAESARQEKISKESPYMGSGTPNLLGKCVGDLVFNHTVLHQDIEVHKSEEQIAKIVAKKVQRALQDQEDAEGRNGEVSRFLRGIQDLWSSFFYGPSTTQAAAHQKHVPVLRKRTVTQETQRETSTSGSDGDSGSPVALLYITSDNPASAKQIEEYARKGYQRDDSTTSSKRSFLPTILAPKGCHVEMDQSWDCSLLTISQWVILSTSDYIVTQTDKAGSPISAYSRYAAVYGLKGDSLRDSKNCGVVQSMYDISRRWNGNWFCD